MPSCNLFVTFQSSWCTHCLSVADLKAKALSATTAGAEKLQDVRRRNTSVPMSKTNWDPYSGETPAPPPPRSLVNRNTKPAPFLPPPSRTSSAASRSLSSSSSASLPPPLPSRGPSSGPPPPPPRGIAAAPAPPAIRSSPQPKPPSIANGPPPIVRSTRPDIHPRPEISKPPTSSETEIAWSNLSPEDKKIFFNWLDEFFTKFTPPSTARGGAVAHHPAITTSHGPQPKSSVSTCTLYL